MPADPLLVTRDCHCLAARRTARTVTRLFEAKLRPHGLKATQFSVLSALRLKGPTALTALADFLVLERTTMTRVATVLARNGWLRDLPAPDARQRLLGITPAGRRKVEAAFPAWQEAQTLTSPTRSP